MKYPSWGLYPTVQNEQVCDISKDVFKKSISSFLPRGNGLSYGDICLNDGGTLGLTRFMDHFIGFDRENGVLECEAGLSFDQILKFIVPHGWFLPVLPGTKYVTLGGAIANDVHGKNHHLRGTIGCHILSLKILRSDGQILACSKSENTNLFSATVAGMGLTGLILSAKVKLSPIASSYIDQEQIVFRSMQEFLDLSKESAEAFEYTAAWVDSMSGNTQRGIFIRGNHSTIKKDLAPHSDGGKFRVPLYCPNWLLNSYSVRAFNFAYFHKNIFNNMKSCAHYDPFITPLDNVLNWNKIYGRRGFLQYQFVVPLTDSGIEATNEIFRIFKKYQLGSFLSVLKVFGNIVSPGMMSFPMPGLTVALDIPFLGDQMFAAMKVMDQVVSQAGGRIYPAKDARMSTEGFQSFFSKLDEFRTYVDPLFSSNFRRRVGI